MERTIRQIETAVPVQPRLTRVAAYARVSSGKDAMLHSLSAQVSFYSQMIQGHDGWQYCGVFSDEAFTGTKENREGFQKLLTECREGNIDLVITKSISRFARNTVTLLQTVRELKLMGVDVYFEEQNIHTMSADGELMMSILASYAQEESLSASENQKWRIRKNFEEGKPWNGALLGYRMHHGQYAILEDEAVIVRRIYSEYLSGSGYAAIAKRLNEDGIPSRFGTHWAQSVISKILSNYTYTGNLILQKTYRENHLTKRTLINQGQLPMYHVTDSHEPIIDMATFTAVQEEKARRAARFNRKPQPRKSYPFTGMMVCENCGKNYRRKITATGPVWVCGTFNSMGKAYCASKQIPEPTLQRVTTEVLETGTFEPDSLRCISSIRVCKGNKLTFCFQNGTEVTRRWADRSRAETWTPEMKKAAREKTLQRRERK